MSFKPQKLGQYEPSTSTSARDCVATVAALLVDRATVSTIRSNHAKIRAASGAPSTRGLYLYEAVNAVKKLYGITLTASLWCSRNTVRDTVAGGSAVGVTIDCSVTRYTTRRTNYYTGLHEVFLVAYNYWPAGDVCGCEKRTTTAHGEFTVEDPGTTSVGYLQWSADLVYRAAEKVTGGSGINLLIAPDTEGRSRKALVDAKLYDTPYRSSKVMRTLPKGTIAKVTSTYNGGGWQRADGTTGYGWHRFEGDLYGLGRDFA